ncbi:MAG: UDP-N-acetylmuramoyl-L-alanyl-D-glutamate--2,6-diaminopimelate ligase [Fimbriimonadaceae bacterium]|nr:UDP-N-acetylmuramoyl-L-alanyl-D-glutamate--2,6-diaminopimelate ligase [Fimbriimonadaceae bacterium]
MKLGALVAGWLDAGAAAGLEIGQITADSRQVRRGALFCALPRPPLAGFKYDGHDYLLDAVHAGAAAVIVSEATRAAQLPVPALVSSDPRWLLPRLAARFHGEPSRKLRLIGVTGTNGKTTVCYLTDEILVAAGWLTVLAGTIETRLAEQVWPATTTTPDPVSLQQFWAAAVEAGVTGGSMEVSSHALNQHRVDHTHYETAVFTNLTQDHLDYHATLEEYFEAKAKLFAADETGWQPRAVLNASDPWCRALLERDVREPLLYGIGQGEVRAEEVRFDASGSSYTALTPAGRWEQRLRIVGPYNVANALAATAAALTLGLSPAVIGAALERAAGAPGRLQVVDAGQPFLCLVDYAHTPDALENALRAVRQLTTGQVIVACGWGGDRDRSKRPLMGRIAAALADRVVVTSDNPRTEDANRVLDDILAGIELQQCRLTVDVDRRRAIGEALAAAEPGDVVLIAGKGHEDYQILGTEKVHFDDREVAREWLASHG